MKFYNREKELVTIQEMLQTPEADLAYIGGRRRIGKTSLILQALKNQTFLYFFVGNKTAKELLHEFSETIQKELSKPYLHFENFSELFHFLFDYAQSNKLIVVFDEFQNFSHTQASVFSELQKTWDLYGKQSHIKLFCLGSHYTLMKDIFENSKAPLYGRKTKSLVLKPFDIQTQAQILHDYQLYTGTNLLTWYALFFGIPKYNEIALRSSHLLSQDDLAADIIRHFICPDSFFLQEGKELFSIEFGKSYDIYFSILSAISIGKNKKSDIANYTWITIDSLGFYLKKLEESYELIKRQVPVTQTLRSKNSQYIIQDLFVRFWFRYIFKNMNLIEIQDFESLQQYIHQDLQNFLGPAFEHIIKDILIHKNLQNKLPFRFQKIGNYFDRKDSLEIDLIALNNDTKQALFVECKLNPKKADTTALQTLKQKASQIHELQDYSHYFSCLSPQDINKLLENKNLGYHTK